MDSSPKLFASPVIRSRLLPRKPQRCGEAIASLVYSGGCSPGDFTQSFTRDAVSACRARFSNNSRSIPGLASAAALRNSAASSAKRSSNVASCLRRRRSRMRVIPFLRRRMAGFCGKTGIATSRKFRSMQGTLWFQYGNTVFLRNPHCLWKTLTFLLPEGGISYRTIWAGRRGRLSSGPFSNSGIHRTGSTRHIKNETCSLKKSAGSVRSVLASRGAGR